MQRRRFAFLRKAFLVMTLASCATASAQYIVSMPTFDVRVHWSTPDELLQQCGSKTAGCTSSATADKPYSEIWAEMPLGWEDDERICALGDQVLAVTESRTSNIAAAPVKRTASPVTLASERVSR